MPFHFAFEAILHLRKSVEHQQELRLRTANQQVAKLRHSLQQIDEGIKELKVRSSQELVAGTTAAELRFAVDSAQSLHERRLNVEHELARSQNLRDQQQRIHQQARCERETFESLRDQQQRTFERDAARREQRRLDDLFLLRQSYLRRG